MDSLKASGVYPRAFFHLLLDGFHDVDFVPKGIKMTALHLSIHASQVRFRSIIALATRWSTSTLTLEEDHLPECDITQNKLWILGKSVVFLQKFSLHCSS